MNLAEVVATLYGADPDGFVSERTALAARARMAKDRVLAREIAALRKPTRGAWLVNLLAREAADELGELLELGPALRETHLSGTAEDLREVTALRRRVVSALVRRALVLGAERGYAATDAVRDEVARTLDAALSQEGVAEAVAAGVLVKAPESAAAFPLDLFAVAGAQLMAVPAVDGGTGMPREPASGPEHGEGAGDDQATGADVGRAGIGERLSGKAGAADERGARARDERAQRDAEAARRRAEQEAEEAAAREARRAELQAVLDEADAVAEAAAQRLAAARDALAEREASARDAGEAVGEASAATAAARVAVAELRRRLAEAEESLARAETVEAAALSAQEATQADVDGAREAEAEAGAAVLEAEAAVEMARAALEAEG